ncbi:hypothetical protein [Rhizobium leguminosarum]|uniref:hypothetical protein n=1 Tax=Rhizobium leguminosarum TaxID=384 RepID=UPI001030B7F9|nr:hypothetical protein [Rhizobium leguminosarum]TAY38511.1 hypothetical protein ELH89_15955 [Rhizobium leguminosarum]
MSREFRMDPPPFEKARGWLDADGHLVAGTADRFATPYAIDDCDTKSGYGHSTRTVGEKGLHYLNLDDVIALGFTKREYQAMMHYWNASTGDHVRSELELTALMSSSFTGHLNDDGRFTSMNDVRDRAEHAVSSERFGDRTYRQEIREEEIQWADPNGRNGRFLTAYVFAKTAPTTAVHGKYLAETGIMDWTLKDVYDWGFTTEEYLYMLLFEIASDGRDHARSEEELNILFQERTGGHLGVNGIKRLLEAREGHEWAGPRDYRYLHPDTLKEPYLDLYPFNDWANSL